MGDIMKNLIIILIASFAGVTTAAAQSPSPSLFGQRPEVGFEYTYAHANAPPGGCGCFSLNGGSISFAQPVYSGHYAGVFDADFLHASTANPSGYDVSLSAFTAGVRYRPILHNAWSPFGQVLVGGVHGSGRLVGEGTPAANDAALVFATNVGGGVDRRLTDHWSARVEADYLLTTFTNGVNDHQNNVRISAGFVYHFSKK
jgi:outer membrane immunogenic protein